MLIVLEEHQIFKLSACDTMTHNKDDIEQKETAMQLSSY